MKSPAEKIDSGKSVAEMWEGFAATVMPDAPPEVRQFVKGAFYAGGLCLFNWFMVQLDTDNEPTDNDLHRVSLIDAELKGFFTKERPHA